MAHSDSQLRPFRTVGRRYIKEVDSLKNNLGAPRKSSAGAEALDGMGRPDAQEMAL